MKTCKKCNKEKPSSEYYKSASNADKLFTKCKECYIAGLNKKPLNPYKFY